jgi:hypothetical protein
MTALNDTGVLWSTRLPRAVDGLYACGEGDAGPVQPDCCWLICNVCCWVRC